MTRDLALWVFGADRPGIVAALTGVLVDEACILGDASMTVLDRHFVMTMLVNAPRDLDPRDLEEALAGAEPSFELTVTVRPLGEGAMIFVEGDAFIVSVYGSDHPGIMHEVACILADASVNITDVDTRVLSTEGDDDNFAILLEVTLPFTLDPAVLDARLQEMAERLGIDASLHPADAEDL